MDNGGSVYQVLKMWGRGGYGANWQGAVGFVFLIGVWDGILVHVGFKKGLKRKRYVGMGLQKKKILVVHNNVDILILKKERPRYYTLGQRMQFFWLLWVISFTDDHSGHIAEFDFW